MTRADMQRFVVRLRERGVKPVSCNCWVRAMNAFCKWLHEQGVVSEVIKLAPQKVEKRLLSLHETPRSALLLGYRPRTFIQWEEKSFRSAMAAGATSPRTSVDSTAREVLDADGLLCQQLPIG
jgi:hypothetical protein